MQRPKRVLCMMDLALEGRASLSSVPSVLAASGLQAVCLPTALLSAHTAGYGKVARQDNAAFCGAALSDFAREGVGFDAILVGYLFGPVQFALATRAFRLFSDALKVVDPALGDSGRLYEGLSPSDVNGMRELCRAASVITPNATETALLCGEDPAAPAAREDVLRRIQQFCAPEQSWLVTSLPAPAADTGDATATAYFDAKNPQAGVCTWASRRAPQSYPGTGDIFAAAITGRLLCHPDEGLGGAVECASRFVQSAAWATWESDGDARAGIWYEPFLHMLHPPHSGCGDA